MCGKLDHLTLGDAADLIEVQTALAFNRFFVLNGTSKGVKNHKDGGNGGATHREYEFRIRRQDNQRDGSVNLSGPVRALASRKTGYPTGCIPTTTILPKHSEGDYCCGAACT